MTPEFAPRPAFEEGWRQRFQDFAADGNDDAAIAGWSDSGLLARLRNFRRVWTPGAPGELWLDAGCGAGTYSRFLAEQGMSVVGLDYSFPTIVKARARSGSAVRWAVGDGTRLPVRTAAFAGAVCFGVTQALARSEILVDELVAAVRPGGEIWIDALSAWCAPHWVERRRSSLQKRPQHVRYESPRQLARVMRERGIVDLRLYWVPILPQRFQRWQSLFEVWLVRLLFSALPPIAAVLSHAFVLRGRQPPKPNASAP